MVGKRQDRPAACVIIITGNAFVINIVQIGLGPLGQIAVRFALERGTIRIVGAVDPARTGVRGGTDRSRHVQRPGSLKAPFPCGSGRERIIRPGGN